MEKKSIQFELWEECNNACKFCFLGSGNRYCSDDIKYESLKSTLAIINNDDIISKYQIISLIGGEFFQGQLANPTISNMFFTIIDRIQTLLLNNKLDELWLNTTMTIGKQIDLYKTLDCISDKSKIWLCTSYDTIGRFHTKDHLDNWKYHMHNIKTKYPNININVSIIITEDLINRYLTNTFSFIDFVKEYKCSLFLKTPGTPVPAKFPQTIQNKQKFNNEILQNFFPYRVSFLKFLAKYKQEVPEYEYNKLYNIHYRADDLYKNTINNKEEYVHLHRVKNDKMADYEVDAEGNMAGHAPENTCGHGISYAPYVDSDACFICDKDLI